MVTSLDKTFGNFIPTKDNAGAYAAAIQFAVCQHPPLLLCVGGVGCGKTHLLESIAIYWQRRGMFARVFKYSRIIVALQNAIQDKESIDSYHQILDRYCRAERLLIDDYGLGVKESDFTARVLEEIIDHRYHEYLPTAITTNLSIDDIPERVVSRLSDSERGVIVRNDGVDYRQIRR